MRTHYAHLSFVLLACSSASEASPTSTDPACPAGDAVSTGALKVQAGEWLRCHYSSTDLDSIDRPNVEVDGDEVRIVSAQSGNTYTGTVVPADGSFKATSTDGYQPGFTGTIVGFFAADGTRFSGHLDSIDAAGTVKFTSPLILLKAKGDTLCPDHP